MNRVLALLMALMALPALAQPHGDPDPSFGVGGIVANPFNAPANEGHRLVSMAELPDGRIIVAGQRIIQVGGIEQRRPLLGLLSPSGAPVSTGDFVNGLFQHEFTPPGEEGWINRLQVLGSGEVLYCGGYTGAERNRALIGRLRSSLQRDAGFGGAGDGWARDTSLGEVADLDCTAIEQLVDGQLIYGGSYVRRGSTSTSNPNLAMVKRLTAQGAADPSYGLNGVVLWSMWGSEGGHVAPLLQSPGGFVRGTVSAGSQASHPDFVPIHDGQVRAYAGLSGGGSSSLFGTARTGAHPLAPAFSALLPEGGSLVFGEKLDRSAITRRTGSGPAQELRGRERSAGRPAGFALLPDGRMLALRIAQPAIGSHQARLELIGADGNSAGEQVVPTGQSVMAGNRELIDVGDLLVQQNGRHLVLLNRREETVASAARTPIRPVLRRYQGNPTDGVTWSLDLQPDPLVLGSRNVRPNVQALSEIVFIEGLSPGAWVPISVRGGEMTVNFDPWSALPRWVRNGDLVRVRGVAPALASTSTVVRVEVGGVRAVQGWRPLASAGSVVTTDFTVTASLPPLPGLRCSSVGGASNCSGAVPDNTAAGLTSSLTLNYAFPAECGYIRSVRVGVDLSHARPGDLRITLRDPNGQVFIGGSVGFVNLLDRPDNGSGGGSGSCAAANVLASFDQRAEFAANEACGLFPGAAGISGELRPSQALSGLVGRRTTGGEGSSTAGTWQLTVRDLAAGVTGTLNDWSLDLDCSATPPNVADLVTSVTGPGSIVGGTLNTVTFKVRNDGPAPSGLANFSAEVPLGPGQNLSMARWTCSATPGSNCVLPPSGCLLGLCPLPVNPRVNLAVGGEATIAITATVDPAASGLEPLVVEGSVFLPLSLDGAFDPNPANDRAVYSRPVDLEADLAADTLSVSRFQPNRLRLLARFSNRGPSLADLFQAFATLPVGYQIEAGSWRCRRGADDCGSAATLNLGGRDLQLSSLSGVADAGTYEWELFATWTGTQPAGQAQLNLVHAPGARATDPDIGNNGLAVPIPTSGAFDQIFANGLD